MMSERQVAVTINCSKHTCLDGGHACPYLRADGKTVAEPWCALFHEGLSSDDQRFDGEIERSRTCRDKELL
jgi:hypothetical protein